MQIIIVGGGPAAVAAALQARELDKNCTITIFSAEKILPYRRPLLVQMLDSEVPAERFFIHDRKFYEQHNIDVQLNSKVIAVDWPENHIILSDQSRVYYDRLLLAYGSAARRLPIPEAEYQNKVATLHDYCDAEKIRTMLNNTHTIAVVGGGILGTEIACQCVQKTIRTIIIERGPELMHGVLDSECGAFLKRHLLGSYSDLNIITNCQVSNLNSNSNGSLCCTLSSGFTGRLTLDSALLAMGFRSESPPWQPPVKDSKLEVDRFMRVKGFENIFAAGDCAFCPGVVSGVYLNALDMGVIAGTNLVGGNEQLRLRVPELRGNFMGFKLYCAGEFNNEKLECAVHTQHDSLRKLYYRQGQLTGCVLLGNIGNSSEFYQKITENSPNR